MDNRENELMEKYQKFIHPEKDLQTSLMRFGLSCGEGWYPLLERLFEAISKTNPPENFEIIQVKEKFGSLRVYADNSSDEIDNLITKAEAESIKTCERCGNEGKLVSKRGWWRTICDSCGVEAGQEINKLAERE
jgi:hypothetical protein